MGSHGEMDFAIPPGLDWLRHSAVGQSWLNCVPRLATDCAERWELTLGKPFPGSTVSLVAPATTTDGADVVLKLKYPDDESEQEGDALKLWGGEGAIRLLDHDPEWRALLLERCTPGSHLSTVGPSAALDVLIDLLPRLWISAPEPFTTLTDEVDRWVSNLPGEFEQSGRPFEQTLLDAAIETLCNLASSQGEQVLLHQDLHGENVLSARREPWLVIDPKPLVGEREFGLSPIIRSAELGHSRTDTLHRLDRLTDELGLDRERARLWAFGHAIAWGFHDGEALPGHVETAGWLLDR